MTTLSTLARRAVIGSALLVAATAYAADWYPLQVKTGPQDDAKLVNYSPLAKAAKSHRVCASFPHMKDPFFLAANYGMVEEAKRLGVRLQTLDAGGYTQLANQVSQIENCVAAGADAVVMVAIARDGMSNLLTELKKKGIPVVDAVNGVSSTDTGARVLTSPRDEGFRAAQYLAQRHPKGSKPVKVGWLPGPAGAGFVDAFNAGFQEGIKDSAVVVAETKNGDVGKEVQARLVEDLLQTHKDLDYLVGTAVMAEAAVPLLQAHKLQDKVKLVSIYMTPGVYQYVKTGQIEAAGSAPVVLTARIMLDEAVRLAEKKVEHSDVYTLGKVYTKATVATLDPSTVLAPASYRPNFNVSSK